MQAVLLSLLPRSFRRFSTVEAGTIIVTLCSKYVRLVVAYGSVENCKGSLKVTEAPVWFRRSADTTRSYSLYSYRAAGGVYSACQIQEGEFRWASRSFIV